MCYSRHAVKYRLVISLWTSAQAQDSRITEYRPAPIESDEGTLVIPEDIHNIRCELIVSSLLTAGRLFGAPGTPFRLGSEPPSQTDS